jgi:hypothetical protein
MLQAKRNTNNRNVNVMNFAKTDRRFRLLRDYGFKYYIDFETATDMRSVVKVLQNSGIPEFVNFRHIQNKWAAVIRNGDWCREYHNGQWRLYIRNDEVMTQLLLMS